MPLVKAAGSTYMYGFNFCPIAFVPEDKIEIIKKSQYFRTGFLKIIDDVKKEEVKLEPQKKNEEVKFLNGKCSFVKSNDIKCKNNIFKNGLCIIHFKKEYPEEWAQIKESQGDK